MGGVRSQPLACDDRWPRELAAVNRTPRDEAGPSAAAERWVAATVSASWDLFRQLRDATVGNVFFNIYGTLSVIAPAGPEAAVAAAPVGRDTPAISRALTRIEEGGFTEAAVRPTCWWVGSGTANDGCPP